MILSDAELHAAMELTTDIDIDDTLFVALARTFGGYLWTGDNKLLKGLIGKGEDYILSTQDLYFIFKELQSRTGD